MVPIIADIDAGFRQRRGDHLLAKKMIEAGACCIQIENQVSDEKQCGHQDGKITVPHIDFPRQDQCRTLRLPRAGRVDDGVIVARTRLPGRRSLPGDRRDQRARATWATRTTLPWIAKKSRGRAEVNGDVVIKREGKLLHPKRLVNLFQFRKAPKRRSLRPGLHHLARENGADLLWIETEKPLARSRQWFDASAKGIRTPSWSTTTAR